MLLRLALCATAFVSRAFAAPQASPSAAAPTSTSALPANPTACGDIVNAVNGSDGLFIFNATDAYQCLTSVPFNPAVASQFIQYLSDTYQFQSDLSYLKSPPATYQQPATDLIAGLNALQEAVNAGSFANEYAFELTLQELINSAHDAHVQLVAGVLSAFSFGSPYSLASVSIDGIQLPKVYIVDDLFANMTGNLTGWQPSAVTQINGMDVVDYLTQFAHVQANGGLEPNADWNMIFESAALDIQGFYELFGGGAMLYPGDSADFTFENGTSTGPVPFLAIYNSPGPTGPLETGGDFYNFFVLGLYPAAYLNSLNSSAAATTGAALTTAAPTSLPTTISSAPASTSTNPGWNNTAYPETPDIAQPDLSTTGGGFLSGYFLNQTKVGVLSIPSFNEYGDDVGTFSDNVTDFIVRARAVGLTKIVIDLQENGGGDVLLAIDTFRQFFPNINPYDGSNRRVHPLGNNLGSTMTPFFQELNTTDQVYLDLIDDEWVVSDELSVTTGQNFSTWQQYYTPASNYNGDSYSQVQEYNLSSAVFDIVASGGIVVSGFANRSMNSAPPYAAEDIIILSDGLCSSACAMFVEMMHHYAGVRTVAVGGRPQYGPMQVPGESRGAREYGTDELDDDIGIAQIVNDTVALPNRTTLAFSVNLASINLRNALRPSDPEPLQFKFEAANCRIFYTPQTWYNYTALWQYAADAIWTNTNLCVSNSTGYATGPSTNMTAQPAPNGTLAANFDVAAVITKHSNGDGPSMAGYISQGVGGTLEDKSSFSFGKKGGGSFSTCSGNADCAGTSVCQSITVCGAKGKIQQKSCLPACSSSQQTCPGSAPCSFTSNKAGSNGVGTLRTGFCFPSVPAFCGSSSTSETKPGSEPSKPEDEELLKFADDLGHFRV